MESRLLCCTQYIAMRASKSIPNIDCFDVQVESILMNMYALHNQQFFSAQLMVAIHVDISSTCLNLQIQRDSHRLYEQT